MESMNMSEEVKPTRKVLFPMGWRTFRIIACSEEVKSKKGNNQYILVIRDMETKQESNLYAVSEPKKRWMLKAILDACGILHENGIYKFEPPLSGILVGKEIMGFVEHEDKEWIDRLGETVKTKQHRIAEIQTVGMVDNEEYDPSKIPDPKPLDESTIAWDEGKT